MSDFPKKYAPKEFEQNIYTKWEQEGKFKPRVSTTGEQFYIPIPPITSFPKSSATSRALTLSIPKSAIL